MHVYGCFVCMYICISKDSIRCNEPMFIDSCKPPFVCWKLNSGLLEKPSVLLCIKPSLLPPRMPYF